ncbi:MAG: pyridoxal phosphate-dependent aminotransferase family protein [Bdellovibrionales bacterium]|nr:pyridoxal phosphate-dependent aminotransferase family protein [Bdellovibrionales bacterium]
MANETKNDLFSKCFNYEESKKVQAAGLYCFFRPIEETTGGNVVTHGKKRVMIGSNNYLGLTHDKRVIEAAKHAIDRFGTGFTGSRFLNGNSVLHEELEEKLARFTGKEAALVFATGFQSNQGALAALMGKNDVIFSDQENHASIIEGTRTAAGKTIVFRHNDMEDLERKLKEHRDQFEGALIVADGVFSMSGDILNWPAVHALAKKYNCRTYIDDAHALGVLGPMGQGTEFHFNMPNTADIVMGTFSKSFASVGGYVAGSKDVINYIKHHARHFMFTAAMPPSAAATVLECLRIVQEEPKHLENLRKNAAKMSTELTRMGYYTLGSQTPIIPLLVGDDMMALAFSQKLYENGVFATPVVRPAVPEGCALIRTSYMASHTEADLDYSLTVLEKLGKAFGILGNPERKAAMDALAEKHFGKRGSQKAAGNVSAMFA